MPEIIKMEIGGIKCDHCTWRDDNVHLTDYHLWLNKACPVCGHNLLTQADFDLVTRVLRNTRIINKLFGWLLYIPGFKDPNGGEKVRLHANGTGKLFVERNPK